MKDALGHGSDSNGAHAGAINKLPVKGSAIMSDATWHAQMPVENYTSQISDLLGMWGGGYLTPSKLSPSEAKQVSDAYEKRANWRTVAQGLNTQRQGDVAAVTARYGGH